MINSLTLRSKRLIDIFGAMFGLAVSLPLFPFIALAIKLESKGPVFFKQLRIGKAMPDRTELFNMIKFRTMGVDAEKNGAQWASKSDPRITRVGKFLRRLSLDELPQLWNILRGEMSLIGPRPFLPSQLDFYGKQHYKNYIRVRPGITGMWQVSGRNRTSFATRAQWDDYYIRNWSFRLDINIMYRTIGVVLQRDGAF